MRARVRVVLFLICLVSLVVLMSVNGSAYRPNTDILLVDDSHRSEYIMNDQEAVLRNYTDPLDELGLSYDVYTVEQHNGLGPTYDKMEEYSTVIWFTGSDVSGAAECQNEGEDCPTIQKEDTNRIEEYLDNRGRLFLTGQYIDDELGGANQEWKQEFYQTYMRSKHVDIIDVEDDVYFDAMEGTYDYNGILPYGEYLDFDTETDMYQSFGTIDVLTPNDYNDDPQTRETEVREDDPDSGWILLDCYSDDGRCYGMATSRMPSYKHVYLTTGAELVFDNPYYTSDLPPKKLMRRVVNYLDGPVATQTEVEPAFVSESEMGAVDLTSRCEDRQYRPHGRGILNAKYLFNSSAQSVQDKLENPRRANGNDLLPSDGAYDSTEEDVEELDLLDSLDDHTNGAQTGHNVTAFVHCKDENRPDDADYATQGYWGMYDSFSFLLDTATPRRGTIGIAGGANKTSDRTPEIEALKGLDPEDTDFFRLSCQSGGPWSDWITFEEGSAATTYNTFNITGGPGCSQGDGKKTVYMQVRDKAGNEQSSLDSEEVWLDATPPNFRLGFEDPANGSAFQPRNLTINATDDLTKPDDLVSYGQQGLFEGCHCLGSGSQIVDYFLNTSFDPEWPETDGENVFKANISDPVDNLIQKEFHYTVDGVAPGIDIVPQNGSYIRSDDNVTVFLSEDTTSVDYSRYDNGSSSNFSFSDGDGFDPGWGEGQEGPHWLMLWVNDTVGNRNTTFNEYRFFVDNNPPKLVSADPVNESGVQHQEEIAFGWVDQDGAGVDRVWYNVDTGSNSSFRKPNETVPVHSSLSEGWHSLTWWSNDTLSHHNRSFFRYFVDNTEPVYDSIEPTGTYLAREDDLTVTVSDFDPSRGVPYRVYNTGSGNTTFTNNTPFDPDWTQDGTKTLRLWINDTADNLNSTSRQYVLDTQPPEVGTEPLNGSYINASGRIQADAGDQGGGEAAPAGVDTRWFDNGTNQTFQDGIAFDPAFASEGWNTIDFWVNDTVGNREVQRKWYYLDTTPPAVGSVAVSNTSFITSADNLSFTVSDAGSGLAGLSYVNTSDPVLNTSNRSIDSGQVFDPGWTAEEEHWLSLWREDAVQNLDRSMYMYRVDDTPPNTTSNYSSDAWQTENQTIALTCEDGPTGYSNSCDTTRYCVGGGSCIPTTKGTTVEVECRQDQVCNTTVRYVSTDKAGNRGPINQTRVLIDKAAPDLSVLSPTNGSVEGGNISFDVAAVDDGAGISQINYSILNASDTSQVFKQGGIDLGQDPNAFWNSTADVGTETVIFKLRANDTLGQTSSTHIEFEVDNLRPTLTFETPEESFHNGDVPVRLSSSRSGEYIDNSSYYIYNTSRVVRTGEGFGAPIHDWRLDEDSGSTAKDSAGLTDGEINGDPSRLSDCQDGGCMNFDGDDDWIKADDDPTLDPTGNITIAFWTRPDVEHSEIDPNNDGDGENIGIAGKDHPDHTWSWQVSFGEPHLDNQLGFQVYDEDAGKRRWADSKTDLQPGTWYHIAARFNGTHISMFVDGVEMNHTSASSIRASTAPFFIGQDGWNYTYNGTVDDFRIYNTSLSSREIGRVYGTGSPHDYDDTLDVASLADGNYSINFTAYDRQDKQTVRWSWFVVDRKHPDAALSGVANESWQTGSISLTSEMNDRYLDNASCKYRYRDEGVWSSNTSLSSCTGSFSFDTENCNDDTEADCVLEVHAQDRAGNRNVSRRYLTIDNSPPTAKVASPQAGSWHNEDVTATFRRKDDQGVKDCSYRINASNGDDSGWTDAGDCSQSPVDLPVDISQYCSVNGSKVCQVTVNATNFAGMTRNDTRLFSIDTERPSFTIDQYANTSNITSDSEFLVEFGDDVSGVSTRVFDNSSGNQTLPSGTGFDPGWTSEGVKGMTFWIVDRAGNTVKRQNRYFVDDTPPRYMTIEPRNDTNISTKDDITVTFYDGFTGVERARYNKGPGFINTFTNDTAFDPGWSSSSWRSIEFRLEDFAENRNDTSYRYFVDGSVPRIVNVTPANDSSIRPQNLTIDLFEPDLRLEYTQFRHGDTQGYRTFPANQSFDPGWQTEGVHSVGLRVNDTVGNTRSADYRYVIDNSTPVVNSVSRNASAVVQDGQLEVSVNATDVITGISEVSVGYINQSSGTVFQTDTLSEEEGLWTTVFTGTDDASMNVTVNVSAEDAVSFTTSDATSHFLVDNAAPRLRKGGVNGSFDPIHGDHRVLQGTPVELVANMSDTFVIDAVNASVTLPNGTAVNVSLVNVTDDRWVANWSGAFGMTDELGLYNITSFWLRDGVGNRRFVPRATPDTLFRVVSPIVRTVFGSDRDAATTVQTNITLDFNHTRTGDARLFIPPSEQGGLQAPYLANVSAVNCVGCTAAVDMINGSVAGINISAVSRENITLSTDMRVYDPVNDTNLSMGSVTAGVGADENVTVHAPLLNATAVFCDGGRTCTVDQSAWFNLTAAVENVQDLNHTGDVENLSVSLEAPNRSYGSNGRTLSSGGELNVSFNVTPDRAGNRTFNVTPFIGSTGYNDTIARDIHVRDTERPNLTSEELFNDSGRLNVNDTAYVRVDASDNIGVDSVNMTITKPNQGGPQPFRDNVSAVLVEGDRQDAIWEATYNATNVSGTYNVTEITALDNYSNRLGHDVNLSFLVRRKSLRVSNNATAMTTAGDPLLIKANVSGNRSTLNSVRVNVSKPRDAWETVDMELAGRDGGYLYETVYRNVSRSGNYSVEAAAADGTETTNTTMFEIGFGEPAVFSLDTRDTVIVPDGASFNLSWSVDPIEGDAVDTNASIALGNNLSTTQQGEKALDNVTFEAGTEQVRWLVDADTGVTGDRSVSVEAVSNRTGANDTANITVQFVDEDTVTPSINSFASVFGTVNLGSALRFYANVSDDSVVKDVVLELDGGGSAVNVSMERVAFQNFTTTYTPGSPGVYNYTVYAQDIDGNWNAGQMKSFRAVDEYDLNVSLSDAVYDKDDIVRVNLTVSDVNGRRVEDANRTVILSKNGTNVTLLPNNVSGQVSTVIGEEDPPTTYAPQKGMFKTAAYTVYANASDGANEGRDSVSFDVTSNLNVTFLKPADGGVIPAGELFNVSVKITNLQGQPISGAVSYVTCSECDVNYRYVEDTESGTYVRTEAFVAPDTGDSFNLAAYATDLRGNRQPVNLEGASTVRVFVSNEESGGGGTGTGGGSTGSGTGGTGGAPPPRSLSITDLSPTRPVFPPETEQVNMSLRTNLAAECGYWEGETDSGGSAREPFGHTGGTLHWTEVPVEAGEQYRFGIRCRGGDNLTERVDQSFVVREPGVVTYSLDVPGGILNIEQGRTEKKGLSVFNNATDALTLGMRSSSSCCRSWFSREGEELESLRVEPGSELSFALNIHVPLNTSTGRYSAETEFSYQDLEREKSVPFIVQKHPDVARLAMLQGRVRNLSARIEQYRRSGVDTEELESELERLNRTLGSARTAVREDDIGVLGTMVEEGGSSADSIEGRLEALAFKQWVGQNWWRVVLGASLLYVLFFLTTMVLIPYYRLRTDYINVKEALDDAVGARKKAEKQYFRREINRDTFLEIMTEKQDEILERRTRRDELEEELDHIVARQVTLANFVKAPIKFVREINRWLHARAEREE